MAVSVGSRMVVLCLELGLLDWDVVGGEDSFGDSPASIERSYLYFLTKYICLHLHEIFVFGHAAIYDYLFDIFE